MRKLKRIYWEGVTFIMTMLAGGMSYAADDPFEAATEKTNEIVESLTGGLAIALCTVAIIVAGLGMLFGKIQKETAFKIIGGAIIIGSAAGIADWLIGGA